MASIIELALEFLNYLDNEHEEVQDYTIESTEAMITMVERMSLSDADKELVTNLDKDMSLLKTDNNIDKDNKDRIEVDIWCFSGLADLLENIRIQLNLELDA